MLWDNLTVKEHLIFYAQIKGIPPAKQEAMAEQALLDVLLTKFANFKISELSGGMKRRVSVAISLVSDPKIIYLDEPSTGLDPENRRQLWDILSAIKGKRAMLLTTHSMEEADVLCNRIAIVNNGILRCVAPQVRLKSLYGGGYHLQINCQKQRFLKISRQIVKRDERKNKLRTKEQESKDKEKAIRKHPSSSGLSEPNEKIIQKSHSDSELTLNIEEVHQRVQDFVKKLIPHADLIREFNGNFIYLISNNQGQKFNPSKIYQQFEANKERLLISDWGLSQSSLEDVFTKICELNGDNNA